MILIRHMNCISKLLLLSSRRDHPGVFTCLDSYITLKIVETHRMRLYLYKTQVSNLCFTSLPTSGEYSVINIYTYLNRQFNDTMGIKPSIG